MRDNLWQLMPQEARAVLETFLETERVELPDAAAGLVALDYSKVSLQRLLIGVAEMVKRGNMSIEDQNVWYTRCGYYFGEVLRRSRPNLFWSLGNAEYAFANHPVIAGFAHDEEAAVITISRNLILSVALDGSPTDRIEKAVEAWMNTPLKSGGVPPQRK